MIVGCLQLTFLFSSDACVQGVQIFTGEILGDHFTFHLDGNFNLPAGYYDLFCVGDDQCGILVNGTNMVGTASGLGPCGSCADCYGKSALVHLTGGATDLSLVFCDGTGGKSCQLTCTAAPF